MSSATLCTKQMEYETREWINKLNFDVLLTKSVSDPLRDKLYNGVFFCELLTHLEKQHVPYNKEPRNVLEARENVERALSILRSKSNIPATYMYNGEKIVAGNSDLVWGLLYHVMKTYPKALTNKTQHYSKSSLYDSDAMRKLEVQTITFFNFTSNHYYFGLDHWDCMPMIKRGPNRLTKFWTKFVTAPCSAIWYHLLKAKRLLACTRIPKCKQHF